MNDPQVEWLRFTISSGEHISYDRPSPKQFTNNVGRFETADGELVVALADHFATIEEARRAVERLLRAREIDADLDGGLGTLRFTYKDAPVVDRNPLPTTTGTVVLSGVAATGGVATVYAVGHSIRRTYPEPPDWLATDDLELAYLR